MRKLEQFSVEVREFTPEEKIALRIACPEAGYPVSEARFDSVEEWSNWLEEEDK